MTQDEIIEMANQAELCQCIWIDDEGPEIASLVAFAKLVNAKATAREREECAKVCDDISFRASERHDAMADDRNDEPILYMSGKESGSKSCAQAIRARGEA